MGRNNIVLGGSQTSGFCKAGTTSDRDRKEGAGSSRYRYWPGTKYDKQDHKARSAKSDRQDRAGNIGGITVSLVRVIRSYMVNICLKHQQIYALVSREGTILTECQVGNHDVSHGVQCAPFFLFSTFLIDAKSCSHNIHNTPE
jgi:hypothetical protein